MEGSINYRQALTKAMKMCSASERCRFEIEAKLRLWDLSDQETQMAIDYLIKEHFLDDERYVRFYVNDKLRFNQWGKIKLSYMLRQKQISESVIKSALSQIDEVFYQKTLYALLKNKARTLKGANDFERKGKLAVFAQNHGFEGDLAFSVAAKVLGNFDELAED